jgi:hypothetical protein
LVLQVPELSVRICVTDSAVKPCQNILRVSVCDT